MADNDILFDAKFNVAVQDFMLARGYEFEPGIKHDAYRKQPVYFFEMHKKINMGKMPDAVNKHFEDVQNRLVSTKNAYQKNLNLQDFYLHVVCHFTNHLKCSIGGLKYLCDIYLLIKKFFKQEDINMIEDVAKNLEIQSDEACFRGLAYKIFNEDKSPYLKEDEYKILECCVQNGEHGNFQIYAKNKLKRDLKNPKKLIKDAYLGLKMWGPKKIIKGFKK